MHGGGRHSNPYVYFQIEILRGIELAGLVGAPMHEGGTNDTGAPRTAPRAAGGFQSENVASLLVHVIARPTLEAPKRTGGISNTCDNSILQRIRSTGASSSMFEATIIV
jgi:hypothetical protein